MKILVSSSLRCTLVVVALLFVCGCGGNSTEPAVTSSQDEMSKYLDEHPELKDVKEDTATATGGV